MNKKCVIVGDTRGLGKVFKDYLQAKGWNVIGFNRKTGLDKVVESSLGCDLFINNAYADGQQINFLNQLYRNVKKMIVCGSVAAYNVDKSRPQYSFHKKKLLERTREIQSSKFKDQADILILNLSGEGYNNENCILEIFELWLKYPLINEISFDPTGIPNE